MRHSFGDGRLIKGVNLVGLVKTVKVARRQMELPSLSPETLALLDDRILVSNWYALQHLWELLDVVYRTMLESKPDNALAMGVMGGVQTWSGPHRVFVGERGPLAVLKAMGPAWASYFDFGSLTVDAIDARTARFTVHGYPDVPVCHGMTIAGWHLAAAQVVGFPDATVEVLERPWDGAAEQVHIVRF